MIRTLPELRNAIAARAAAKAGPKDQDIIQEFTLGAFQHLDKHGDFSAIAALDHDLQHLLTGPRVSQWRAYVQHFTWLQRDASGKWSKSHGKVNDVELAAQQPWFSFGPASSPSSVSDRDLRQLLQKQFDVLQDLIDSQKLNLDGEVADAKDVQELLPAFIARLRSREASKMVAEATKRFNIVEPNAPKGMRSGLRRSPFLSGGLPSLGKKR